MISPAPAVRPRPMGGFNQGFGNFSDEHLDEGAMQKMMQQKALQQQQTSTAPQSGKVGTNPLVSQHAQPSSPREVSTIPDELVKRPLFDIAKGLRSIFDINALLGIGPTDTPEEQARKQEFHKRYQSLTEDEKQEAQKRYKLAMEKKKHEREEEEMKKQQEQQKKKSAIAPPSSTKKGPVGPASGQSKKASTMAMMEHDRKTLGNAGKKF